MPYESPASILYDSNGLEMAVSGGLSVPAGTQGWLMAGINTTNTASYLRVDSAGALQITGSISTVAAGTQTVTGTVAIQGLTNVSGALPVFLSASNLLTITGAITVANTPTVVQGNAGSIGQSWFTRLTDGAAALGVIANPLFVTGSVTTTPTGVQTVTGSVAISGVANVRQFGNPTAVLTNVASSITSVTILASNANRKQAIIYNDSTKKLYLKFGATASTTSFTILVFRDSYYEVPGNYSGIIDGIWDAVNGSARVTEIT